MTDVAQAELAVLNILLKNPQLVFDNHPVRPFMFGSSIHTTIANAIFEIGESKAVPEQTLLLSHLETNDKLKEAGGVEYINYIVNQSFAVENLAEYERTVLEIYKTRQVRALATQLQSQVNAGSVDSVIETAKKGLDAISQLTGSEQVDDIETVTRATWNNIITRVENPGIRGVTTGFRNVDLITGGYNEGDLWIIGGRPGSGKSAHMCNSALKTALAGSPVLIFTLEMSNVQIAERMISLHTGVPYQDIRNGTLDRQQLEQIKGAITTIKSLPIYIDSNVMANDTYFASVTRKYHKDKGIRVAFFDYIQLGTERDTEQTAALGRFSRTGKLLARDLKITNVFYTQLNRNVEARDDKHPVLPDIRQSGNLEEDADIVKLLYRDEYYHPTTTKSKGVMEFILAKHRNGQTGVLFATFNAPILRIEDKD